MECDECGARFDAEEVGIYTSGEHEGEECCPECYAPLED
jgi:hypothetical protein